jgi:hypothetical protein
MRAVGEIQNKNEIETKLSNGVVWFKAVLAALATSFVLGICALQDFPKDTSALSPTNPMIMPNRKSKN